MARQNLQQKLNDIVAAFLGFVDICVGYWDAKGELPDEIKQQIEMLQAIAFNTVPVEDRQTMASSPAPGAEQDELQKGG